MTKTCPNCGNQLNDEEKTCPNCGHTFEDKKQQTEETTTTFTTKEQNENIEWSELKDMSIGHVMTMFNEQQNDKATATSEQDPKQSSDETLKDEAAAQDSSPLNQYINEHRNEKEAAEQSKELENDATEPAPAEEKTVESAQEDTPAPEITEMTEEKQEGQPSEQQTSESVQQRFGERPSISRFTKPEETETTVASVPIGPKAPPQKFSQIPSKSKRPEEIEMDEAPIFFKEADELPNNQDNQRANEPSAPNDKSDDSPKSSHVKNYKKFSIALAAVVVLAGGSWAVYSQLHKEPVTQAISKQEKAAEKADKELNSYFTDKSQTFIKSEMVNVSPKSIKTTIDSLKEEDTRQNLENTYNKVVEKQADIVKVNELFIQPIINGEKLNDSVLKADKKVTIAKRAEKDAFDKLLNQAISEASAQYDQLQKAKTAVAGFYQNNEFTTALTKETYNSAKTEVDKIKNEALRNPLNETLAKADKVLADAEAANAVAEATNQTNQQAEEQGQADQTQANATIQQDANGFSAPNADGVYTDPVYPVNPADVADMSNSAWIWAPGVQEKVIATCIQRGYITADTYSLQPARIVDGEGYYNLYGADNQYLVTINAKTGWFKGNASRNAGR
ncbi:zinc-ribbon domain-containing protein [Erwinia sp. CPCC 100877]|nr:zinc-ribbon domain-containing protein [Erwinia sp. CPCC 100877]